MTRGYFDGEVDETNPVHMIAHTWLERAIKGRRGQSMLRDLADALDAMPEKRLVRGNFTCTDGLCTLGALATARGVDMTQLQERAHRIQDDPDDWVAVEELNDDAAKEFKIARSLAAEVMYTNDTGPRDETPEQRWKRMRQWVDIMREDVL